MEALRNSDEGNSATTGQLIYNCGGIDTTCETNSQSSIAHQIVEGIEHSSLVPNILPNTVTDVLLGLMGPAKKISKTVPG
ncbi:unnamed protein product [Meloidogyne enterolobii]|uniref:Uncharacterized protein n=1 Tax=Meloidogyne enterolobii TaxID=390850 RepID=A0ACB0YUR2_MELEN